MVAVEPRPELGQMFDDAGGSGKPRVGQIAVAYDLDERAALKRARDQFRWFTAGWRVNAELPLPASFDVASKTVRDEDVTAQMPCGPDVQRHIAGIREFEAAGYTHIALVQVGAGTQEEFISWAAAERVPALPSSCSFPRNSERATELTTGRRSRCRRRAAVSCGTGRGRAPGRRRC